MSDDSSSQRRYDRICATLPVRVSTIEPENDPHTGRPFFRALQETCANVSRGGAFVRTRESLTPGRRVLLELSLPSGAQVETIGRVAWTKRVISPASAEPESGIGIEFLGAASEHFAALEQFLRRDTKPNADDSAER
ncbi:MAG: PilZ domain-containing protein [Myxococcales bacterium]|nr:PilZ domain-containing protein [Myxococcales bacterium]MDH5306339.1 PilZ domain-containing protein [Myxococcales bacterium]MDH5566266.1 PilZ domain-containing protein [Myxococcales bacterium]